MTYPNRLQPSGLNLRFNSADLRFPEYLSRTHDLLTKVHQGKEAAQRIAGNAPFELFPPQQDGQRKPCRRGILLTHGLSDSPYHVRHLAEFFRAQGFRVMAVLLPGHGTVPGDLLHVHWRDWAATVAYGVECLSREVDEIYLGGFSAGGTLSLRHSLLDPRIRGLFLFAPALKISARARWANLHKLYSWLMPEAQWVDVLPDTDLYKYESFAKNAAAQMYALIADTQALLGKHKVAIPLFAAASLEDATVDTHATLQLLNRASHPACRMVLYTTQPEAGRYSARIEVRNSTLLEQRILSLAHTAIVIAPEDPHYGAGGNYANCLHYYRNDPERYGACWNKPDEAWLGELNEKNLNVGLLRRLMYNPCFPELKLSMQSFISALR